MRTRRWIGIIVLTVFVLALLALSGYTLYRYGYSRGFQAASADEGFPFHGFEGLPQRGGRFGDLPRDSREDLPRHWGERQVAPYPFGALRSSPFAIPLARSWLSPLSLLLMLIFLGLVIGLLYAFVTLFRGGRSWQLSFHSQAEPEPEQGEKPKGKSRSK